jgi:flagellum-specific peptidoglycan hydrolase FlgJ
LQYKGTYKGINDFGKSTMDNRFRKLILSLIFIITLITTVVIATSKLINSFDNNIILSKEEIQNYINVTDELSKASYQLNWQEVAAINSAINNGSFEINNDNMKNIGNALIKKDSEGNAVGINTFKSAINNLGLNSEQEDLAIKNLDALRNNYINENLSSDNNKLEFIESVSEVAYDNYKNYGILPSITISQAILESGWGGSTLSSEYNNLFGIKADSRWSGESVALETKENYDDVIVGAFRAYDSFKASIKDHGKFLSENERYANNGLFEGKTYKEQAQALENAGYSTAKDEDGNLIYADKLIRVIQENNLMFYDTIAERN